MRSAAAWAIGRMGRQASGATPAVARLLKDENVRVRESASLALGEMEEGAAGAVSELSTALRDPAATVRMSAARALGRMGEAAQAAIFPMQEALLAAIGPDMSAENIQVARNLCTALGDLGPVARPALPALRKVQHLRVIYIAEAAIAKIEGSPTPLWH